MKVSLMLLDEGDLSAGKIPGWGGGSSSCFGFDCCSLYGGSSAGLTSDENLLKPVGDKDTSLFFLGLAGGCLEISTRGTATLCSCLEDEETLLDRLLSLNSCFNSCWSSW